MAGRLFARRPPEVHMIYRGRVSRWDDDKGFGFITSEASTNSIFVHIKAFRPQGRRPVQGEEVSYTLGEDDHGKPRADKARYSDSHSHHDARRNGPGIAPVVFTLAFIAALVVAAQCGRMAWLVAIVYGIMRVATFLIYARDKHSARKSGWRTPESTLFFTGLLGGWPGALAAQRMLHHKSGKRPFLRAFWVTVDLNIAGFCYLASTEIPAGLDQLALDLWRILI